MVVFDQLCYSWVQIWKLFESKIVTIFLPIILTCVLGAQKNRLIETVLLSTHNICLGLVIRKIIFYYILLPGSLI